MAQNSTAEYEHINHSLIANQSRFAEAKERFGSGEQHELEKTYGKYYFVPLDVPEIKPNDPEKFKDFYMTYSKPSFRIRSDIAGVNANVAETHHAQFRTLSNQPTLPGDIWTRSYVPEFNTEFKEIFEQMYEYLPLRRNEELSYTIWSSLRAVIMHRDAGSLLDLPINFRIKLYDENPSETLLLKNCLLTDGYQFQRTCSPIPLPKETNTWVWNNLRMVHGSTYEPNFIKMLMIIERARIDWKKYVDLMDRSISKFKDNIMIDNIHSFEDYITITKDKNEQN